MTRRRRLWLLLFLAVAVAGIVLLSTALPHLTLLPGRPFYLGEPSEEPTTPATSPEGPDFWAAVRIILPLMIWIGLPLFVASIIWAILRKKKAYLITVLMLIGWGALILYLELTVMQNPQQLWQLQPAETPQPEQTPSVPIDVFTPTAPDWLVYAASFGLAVLLLAIGWSLWQALRPKSQPLLLVAEQAQSALEEINAGADWKDVITRCYADMCRALHKGRGLVRKAALTPREFALELEQAGLPGEQIQRLTRLFETVRYGGKQVGPQEEVEAVACLAAVVQVCGRAS